MAEDIKIGSNVVMNRELQSHNMSRAIIGTVIRKMRKVICVKMRDGVLITCHLKFWEFVNDARC